MSPAKTTSESNNLRVAVLLDAFNDYSRGLLKGIANYRNNQSDWVVFYDTTNTHKNWRKWKPAALITGDHKLTKGKTSVILDNITIFSIKGEGETNVLFKVINDNKAIGVMAAEHLMERGFQNFAFFGFEDLLWSQDRSTSFKQKIMQNMRTHKFYEHGVSSSKRLFLQEQKRLINWLKAIPKPIGLLTCNDEAGRIVLEAAKLANQHIPDDIAVLGVDNDVINCGFSLPPLSSIALNTERAGYEIAETLDQWIKNRKTPNQNITVSPVYVVKRQSTDILAINDIAVTDAIRFIREHVRENIQVTNVYEAVGVSRRTLEIRFKNSVGHSVSKEIKICQINLISEMLLNTNYSMLRIARIMGHSNEAHIARFFCRYKGMNPLAYRQKYQDK